MSYTETTTTSWFARLKNALIGFFIGLLLVGVAVWLLFWNEGRAIGTYRSLAEGAGLVVTVESMAVDPANERKLVHLSGPVKPEGIPGDSRFGIEAPGAISISRAVEMYQWIEESDQKTEKKLGGSEETVTTYRYIKDWRSTDIPSDRFNRPDGHENPGNMLESETYAVDQARIGAFAVDGSDLAGLGTSEVIVPGTEEVTRFAEGLGEGENVIRNGDGFYIGANRSAPQIGDMRVRYTRSDLSHASIIAAQRGDRLVEYRTSNGRGIFLAEAGDVDSQTMFQTAQSVNSMITWAVRVGGLVCMFVGFSLMFSILGVIGDVVPFIGSVIGFGTTLVALVLTLIIGPVVIALGWFAYRPVLALSIIAGALAVAAGVVYLRRKQVPPALGRPAS